MPDPDISGEFTLDGEITTKVAKLEQKDCEPGIWELFKNSPSVQVVTVDAQLSDGEPFSHIYKRNKTNTN